jgi:hypothetical protein
VQESPQSLRVSTKVRGFLITYGLAAFAVLVPLRDKSEVYADAFATVVLGLAFQALVILARVLTTRYERKHRMEGQLMPMAMYVAELVADAVSVFLFALGTFRTINSFTAGL